MHAPQILFIALMVFNVGITIGTYDPAKKDTHNVIAAFIGSALQLGLVYWGGFFG